MLLIINKIACVRYKRKNISRTYYKNLKLGSIYIAIIQMTYHKKQIWHFVIVLLTMIYITKVLFKIIYFSHNEGTRLYMGNFYGIKHFDGPLTLWQGMQ